EPDGSSSGFSTTAIVDGQGNFRLPGLAPGHYQIMIMDVLDQTGYTGDPTALEITNDNLSGIEVKAFLGATISGVVTVEGGDTTIKEKLQQLMIRPDVVELPSSADGAAENRSSMPYVMPMRINADGSFTVRGVHAGKVSFRLIGYSSNPPRIKRIE